MAKAPLTRRQHQIVEFLRGYIQANGISPTLEEIAAEFGVNKVTIFGHVKELERKRVLHRPVPGASRGLQLVENETSNAELGAGHAVAGMADSGLPTSNSPFASSLTLPILGRIAAGAPIEAIEDVETLDFADLVPDGSEVYALRVQGESMIEDAIADGDIVLVERRETARNGETVVAVLPDGDATLKRFYREEGRIRLQPANSTMDPIYANSVEIRGVVIGVVRRF